ncbi:MAG: thioesterase family protein [Ilumatobacteraceae bacterium]
MHSDADFLGLTPSDEPGRYHFTVENHLARLDGRLYGGTAIGASIATAELVTERRALWMTTQFIATAPPGAEIDVLTEVLAPGRRTNQVRITGTDAAGDIMFASLGATGHYKADGLAGTFERAPEVSPPHESSPWANPFVGIARNAGITVEFPNFPKDLGFNGALDFREPTVEQHPDPGPGRMCVWARRRDRVAITPAIAAYIADMVPLSVAHACGVLAGGISLDNSIRIGAFEATEWVLIDLRPHLAVGDYGHGTAHVWSEAGTLLATASQTASMMRFDPADLGAAVAKAAE